MICIKHGSMVSFQKRSREFYYHKFKDFKLRSWPVVLTDERGQVPIGPTILVEWKE